MLAQLFTLLPLLAIISATPINKRALYQLIHTGRDGECVSINGGRDAVTNGQLRNGLAVVAQSCDTASLWDISKGSGSITVSGSRYALDIGLSPGINGVLKVYIILSGTQYPTSPQQTWYLTDDNRIAQTGGNQCMDRGTNGMQTYQCTPGNTNQIFIVGEGNVSPTPSSSSSGFTPSATSSAAPAPSATGFDVLPNVSRNPAVPDGDKTLGIRVRPVGRPDLCVSVAGGEAVSGALVSITSCFPDSSPLADLQRWQTNPNPYNTPRLIQLSSHPDLCLDAGSNPSNGGGMKIWTCGGYPQQLWKFNTGIQFESANNQCLDIKKESSPTLGGPYDLFADLQTWQCSTNGDPYQKFTM